MDLVELVRTKLTPLEKINISPLIVQGVHEREVVSNQRKLNVNNVFEFEWVSQLRF